MILINMFKMYYQDVKKSLTFFMTAMACIFLGPRKVLMPAVTATACE